MARTKQYVVYTREFTKGRVNSKVGVFIDEAKNAMDKTGSINGGVINHKNLAMTRTSLSLFNKLRPYSIGFDNAFDSWDRFFTDDFNLTSAMTSSFPAYDIIKKNEHQYQIQLALAGFSKGDIEVEVKENVLSIRSKDKTEEDVETDDGNVIHKGIAKRHFERTFTIADDTVVKGAELKDGLLSVELERIIPEEKKAKLIDIK